MSRISEKGQGLVEYVLIMVFVALIMIAVLVLTFIYIIAPLLIAIFPGLGATAILALV